MTWRSRSRFSLLALALVACESDPSVTGTPVAKVGDEVLTREVIEMIAERDGVDEASARARALATLRFVAARRSELAERVEAPTWPDDLDPARAARLRRKTMVELWLREDFEPAHESRDMPDSVIEAALNNPATARRLFHPEVFFVCQVLIVPAGEGQAPPRDPAALTIWRTRAEAALAPFAARAKRLEPELVGDPPCEVLAKLAELSQREFAGDPEIGGEAGGPLRLRFESFGFAPSNHQLDATWVEKVVALPGLGLTDPFATDFGVHLVLLAKVEPARLADGSMPPEPLDRARREFLREHLLVGWRSEELSRTISAARDARVVRLDPRLGERGP